MKTGNALAFFLATVLLLLKAPGLGAGTDKYAGIDAQVAAIQKMELVKFTFEFDYNSEMGGYDKFGFYKDAAGFIRIFFKESSDEAALSRTKAFYDDKGALLLFLSGHEDDAGGHGHKRYYFIGGRLADKDGTAAANLTEDISNLISVKSLVEEYGKTLKAATNEGNVIFGAPETNDKCDIQNMNVNVRQKPDKGSAVVGTLDAMDKVTIMETGKSETIGGYGENRWYRIHAWTGSPSSRKELNGWVYGAFIPPAEKMK